jgi:hypothetical protein
MGSRVVTPKLQHEAAYEEIAVLLDRYAGTMTALEMLAVAANLVGKLVALQDQRVTTPAQAMEVVALNIELGNKQVIEELAGSVGGGVMGRMIRRRRHDVGPRSGVGWSKRAVRGYVHAPGLSKAELRRLGEAAVHARGNIADVRGDFREAAAVCGRCVTAGDGDRAGGGAGVTEVG